MRGERVKNQNNGSSQANQLPESSTPAYFVTDF